MTTLVAHAMGRPEVRLARSSWQYGCSGRLRVLAESSVGVVLKLISVKHVSTTGWTVKRSEVATAAIRTERYSELRHNFVVHLCSFAPPQ